MKIKSLAILFMCLIMVGCASRHEKQPPLVINRSSPEKTLRTFWAAIQAGDTNMALACTNPERIAKVPHGGRDVMRYIGEHSQTDSSTFRFIGGGNGCSVQSPTHCMDYDMEKNDKGEWIIVSIHP